MLKRMFFKKLVSKMVEDEFLDDEDDDDEDPLSPVLGGGPRRGAMKFFKQSRRFVSSESLSFGRYIRCITIKIRIMYS